MARYKSNLNHNGIAFGEIVDIPDHEIEAWTAEIADGFLTPLDDEAVTEAALMADAGFETPAE